MIPLEYYTPSRKVMRGLVNRKVTIALALVTLALILPFNVDLSLTTL
jgi:hypothetical protein